MAEGSGSDFDVKIVAISGEVVVNLPRAWALSVKRVKAWLKKEFGYPVHSQELLLGGGATLDNNCLLARLQEPPLLLTLVLLPFSEEKALLSAAKHGHERAAKALLSRAAQAAEAAEEAAAGGGEGELRLLMLLQGADGRGQTALHLAAAGGHEPVCRALLEAAPSGDARSKLLHARSSRLGGGGGEEEGAEEEEEDDDGADGDGTGMTALHVAAQHGHVSVCWMLLEMSADDEERKQMLEAKTPGGQTALHLAASSPEHQLVCQALLGTAPPPRTAEALLLPGSQGRRQAAAAAPRRRRKAPPQEVDGLLREASFLSSALFLPPLGW